MIKKYIYLLPLIALGFFISSCDDNTTEPNPTTTGGIYITSAPVGAQIWVDGSNKNKVTPDSVTGLATGTRSVTLKLNGYRDTTFTITVVANTTVPKFVTLTSSGPVLVTYSNVKLWETTGTSASQPSGLVLSSGSAIGISSAQKDSVDIYYSSTGFVVRTASGNVNTRDTKFLVGSSSALTDGVASPVVSGSWVNQVLDTQANYFFLYDEDGHYSKMIITSRGGGTPGDPAWVIVTWIYNQTANDVRF